MTKEAFGEKIRKLRQDKKIGLRKMADMMDISYAYLSRIETGKEAPPVVDKIKKMAEILDVSYEDLLQLAKRIDPSVQDYVKDVAGLPEFLRKAKEKGKGASYFEKLKKDLK